MEKYLHIHYKGQNFFFASYVLMHGGEFGRRYGKDRWREPGVI